MRFEVPVFGRNFTDTAEEYAAYNFRIEASCYVLWSL
jgi:hypothetical protein